MQNIDIDWTNANPTYTFESEVDALETLQALANELESARQQVHHTMRYMRAAVLASQGTDGDDLPVSKQAVIAASGLSRRTVYGILGDEGLKPVFDSARDAAVGMRQAAEQLVDAGRSLPTADDLARGPQSR
jgi:hypothetical protein